MSVSLLRKQVYSLSRVKFKELGKALNKKPDQEPIPPLKPGQ
jgi:hypothetical protein